jgi:hypothetical protein
VRMRTICNELLGNPRMSHVEWSHIPPPTVANLSSKGAHAHHLQRIIGE